MVRTGLGRSQPDTALQDALLDVAATVDMDALEALDEASREVAAALPIAQRRLSAIAEGRRPRPPGESRSLSQSAEPPSRRLRIRLIATADDDGVHGRDPQSPSDRSGEQFDDHSTRHNDP